MQGCVAEHCALSTVIVLRIQNLYMMWIRTNSYTIWLVESRIGIASIHLEN